jgi:hypothetical protein
MKKQYTAATVFYRSKVRPLPQVKQMSDTVLLLTFLFLTQTQPAALLRQLDMEEAIAKTACKLT